MLLSSILNSSLQRTFCRFIYLSFAFCAKNKSKWHLCYSPVLYLSNAEKLKPTEQCGVSSAMNSVHNDFNNLMIEKHANILGTNSNLKGADEVEYLIQWTLYTNHTTLYTNHTRKQHLITMGSKCQAVMFKKYCLSKFRVMCISVSRSLDISKHSSFMLDTL